MKLLGWMHRKLQHNSIEPFKDFTIGNYCTCLSAQSSLEDQDSHAKPSFSSRYVSRSLKQPKQEHENPFSELEAKGLEDNLIEETSMVISELFHGFLAIGTLGSEPILSEPATPTFAISLENIAKEKTEVTENDLKLINDELEKFLEAEAEEEGCNESSARSSYVSNITLSGKPLEEAKVEDNGKTVVCPLQGYLFGSSIELPETKVEVKKEKASLGELFQRTKIADENSTEKFGEGDMQVQRTYKSAKHFFKKMLKKLHASPRSSTPSTNNDSFSTKNKLHKVIQMFHRKIHPESSTAEKELNKFKSYKINNALYDGGYNNGDLMHQDKDNKRFPQGSKSKEGTQCYEINYKLHNYGDSGNNSSGNGEHWIKTDADYLVLEL